MNSRKKQAYIYYLNKLFLDNYEKEDIIYRVNEYEEGILNLFLDYLDYLINNKSLEKNEFAGYDKIMSIINYVIETYPDELNFEKFLLKSFCLLEKINKHHQSNNFLDKLKIDIDIVLCNLIEKDDFANIFYHHVSNLFINEKDYFKFKKYLEFLPSLVNINNSQIIELTERLNDYMAKQEKDNIPKINFNQGLKNKVLSLPFSNGRYCLTGDFVFSIDSDGTNLKDDAISIEILPNDNYLLGVYIADVISFIQQHSTLKQTIKSDFGNYNNIYKKMSSLNTNAPKYALAHLYEIDKKGNIIDFEILKAIINVNYNLYHSTFNEILSNCNHQLFPKLNLLYNFSLLLTNQDDCLEKSKGNLVVKKCMVMTNEYIANFFEENQFPFLYLVSSKEIIDKNPSNFSNDKLKNYHIKSWYSIYNTGYFRNTYQETPISYGRVTSPIIEYVSKIGQLCQIFYMFNDFINPSDEKLLLEYLKDIHSKDIKKQDLTSKPKELKKSNCNS